MLYSKEACTLENYFYSTWKEYCYDVKVRKTSRFKKCGACERLGVLLLKAGAKRLPAERILSEKEAHVDFVVRKCRE